jgi:hypothetical protein
MDTGFIAALLSACGVAVTLTPAGCDIYSPRKILATIERKAIGVPKAMRDEIILEVAGPLQNSAPKSILQARFPK